MSVVPLDQNGVAPGFAFDGRWLPGVKFTPRPTQNDSFSFASAGTLNEVAAKSEPQQWTLAAEDRCIPVVYGRQRMGAIVANALPATRSGVVGMVLQCVISEGEIQSIGGIQVNDAAPPVGAVFEVYLGKAVQAVSPLLAAAFSALPAPVSYTDTLPNVAYFVAFIPTAGLQAFPRLTAMVLGKRCFDPRDAAQVLSDSSTWKWTDNPSIALADFVREGERYGMGKTPDWADVAICANHNDALLGTPGAQERARTVNIAFLEPAEIQSVADALRTYAGVWLDPQGSVMRMIADRPRGTVGALTQQNTKSVEYLDLAGLAELPTVVEVLWTDTSRTPWASRKAVALHPGVTAGTLPRRIQQISLPGIHSYGQAYREAVQQLNTQRLADLSLGVTVFDEGAVWQKGDVLSASFDLGLAGKLFYIVKITDVGFGRWRLDLREYDPAFYADFVATEPTFTNAGDGNCLPVPTVSSLTTTQVNALGAACTCERRLQVSFTAPYYPCLQAWEIELYEGGALYGTYSLWAQYAGSFSTPPLTAGLAYTVRMRAVPSALAVGASPGAWVSSAPMTVANTDCAPPAPTAVWVRGIRSYATYDSPPFIDSEFREAFVSAPICAVSATQFYFDYTVNGNFAAATLVHTAAGYQGAFAWFIDSGDWDNDGFLDFGFFVNWNRATNTGTPYGGASGVYSYWIRPTPPRWLWVRFVVAGVASAPVRVFLPEHDRDLANPYPGTYIDRKLYTLSGYRFVPVGGAVDPYPAQSGGQSLGNFTDTPLGAGGYTYLGGTAHQVEAAIYASGAPASGDYWWRAWSQTGN
jgi:hypothetical protein